MLTAVGTGNTQYQIPKCLNSKPLASLYSCDRLTFSANPEPTKQDLIEKCFTDVFYPQYFELLLMLGKSNKEAMEVTGLKVRSLSDKIPQIKLALNNLSVEDLDKIWNFSKENRVINNKLITLPCEIVRTSGLESVSRILVLPFIAPEVFEAIFDTTELEVIRHHLEDLHCIPGFDERYAMFGKSMTPILDEIVKSPELSGVGSAG